MSAAVAPPNNTYVEGTSKDVSSTPMDSKYEFLKKNDKCEIVEAATMFVHNGKYYSNGPFITVTLNNQPVVEGRYGYTTYENLPTVKMSDGTIQRQYPSPSADLLFYFVIKNAASGGRKTRNQKRKSTRRRKSKTRHAMKYR
jgi:hypothetical protein